VADAIRTGWMIVPIILLFAVVHAFDTAAWWVVVRDEPRRPPLGELYRMVVAGSALNFVTPVVNVGGEPFKAAMLTPYLGLERAAGAVVLRAMVRATGTLLFWLTALGAGLVLLDRTPVTVGLLAIGLVGVGLLLWILLRAHHRGGLASVLDRLLRTPGLRWLGRRLATYRPVIAEMDEQIVEFTRAHPHRLAQAIGFDYLGRAVFVLEFCLIGAAIGLPVRYPDAFVVGGLEALVSNLLFFVPFEVGTRESATAILFQQLGYPAEAGLFVALVSRIRDLTWIAAGLGLVALGGRTESVPDIPGGNPA